METIETERLIIRRFIKEDLDDVNEYLLQRRNEKYENTSWYNDSLKESILETRIQSNEFLAVYLKSEKKVVGNLYIGNRPFNSKEIGYVFNKNYFRLGYGSEAVGAIIKYLFECGVHRVYAECDPENIASWKLMEKVGMKREGKLIQNVCFIHEAGKPPYYTDTYIYGLVNPADLK